MRLALRLMGEVGGVVVIGEVEMEVMIKKVYLSPWLKVFPFILFLIFFYFWLNDGVNFDGCFSLIFLSFSLFLLIVDPCYVLNDGGKVKIGLFPHERVCVKETDILGVSWRKQAEYRDGFAIVTTISFSVREGVIGKERLPSGDSWRLVEGEGDWITAFEYRAYFAVFAEEDSSN